MPHPPNSGAFAEFLDVHVRAPEAPAEYEVEMQADGRHLNQNGIVHGGVAMTLLDMAMAGAVVRTLAPDERTASVAINTNFLRAAKPGRLVARGRVARRGRALAFPEGEVVDAEGNVVARGSGVWAVTKR